MSSIEDAKLALPVKLDELLHKVHDKYRHEIPGMACAVFSSRGLLAMAACGQRHRDFPIPVTRNDMWHLGSITKSITATMIASLVEDGLLRWETTLAETFQNSIVFPSWIGKASVLELLSHRAGLPSNINWSVLAQSSKSMREQRRDVVKQVAEFKDRSVKAGECCYSNLGVVVAAAIAENVTECDWESLVVARVFKPLHMQHFGFGHTCKQPAHHCDNPWPHLANGVPAVLGQNAGILDNHMVMGPAGAVHVRLQDFVLFLSDQLAGEVAPCPERSPLRKPETYRFLHTSHFSDCHFALGWLLAFRRWAGARAALTHSGSNTMNYAVVWMAPSKDFGVVISCNRGGDVAAQACDALASEVVTNFPFSSAHYG